MSLFHQSNAAAPRGLKQKVWNWSAPVAVGALMLLGAGKAQAQSIRVMLNGDHVRFADVGPQEVDGRVMVPVRGVLEQMGADVTWDEADQRVTAKNATVNIRLRLGEHHAWVNGQDMNLDVPAQMIGGRTMVPLRFLSEALGASVRWDDADRTVFIKTGDDVHRDRPVHFDPNNRRREPANPQDRPR